MLQGNWTYWSIPHNLRGSYSRATRVNAPLRRESGRTFYLRRALEKFWHSAPEIGPILPVCVSRLTLSVRPTRIAGRVPNDVAHKSIFRRTFWLPFFVSDGAFARRGQCSSLQQRSLPGPELLFLAWVHPGEGTFARRSGWPHHLHGQFRTVFVMAAALNACGYDEGLEDSAPVRKRVAKR